MCQGDAKPNDDGLIARLIKVVGSGEPETVEVWSENYQIKQVFSAMLSQWNVGMNGVIGLRYEALPLVLELHGIEAEQRREVFDGLRVMERAAVEEINKH
ncbi:MAG: DUF1799 domain-containing protein [Gallionellaceae bacterium]